MNDIFAIQGMATIAMLGRQEIVVLAVLGFILVIVLFGMWMGWQTSKLKEETIREAVRLSVEKGQALPEGLIDPANVSPEVQARRRRDRAHVELLVGLLLVAVGGGLFFIVKMIAPLVLFVGVAFLICAWFERR